MINIDTLLEPEFIINIMNKMKDRIKEYYSLFVNKDDANIYLSVMKNAQSKFINKYFIPAENSKFVNFARAMSIAAKSLNESKSKDIEIMRVLISELEKLDDMIIEVTDPSQKKLIISDLMIVDICYEIYYEILENLLKKYS